MNKFILIVIIILKYVLGFINNIIIILVINSTSVHVFFKECKKDTFSIDLLKEVLMTISQKIPCYLQLRGNPLEVDLRGVTFNCLQGCSSVEMWWMMYARVQAFGNSSSHEVKKYQLFFCSCLKEMIIFHPKHWYNKSLY